MKTVNLKELRQEHYAEINSGKNVKDNLKSMSVEELYTENQVDRLPYHVMVFNLMQDANIGAIIRNSILNGASKVWIFGRSRYDRRSTVGAHHYIDVETVDGFEDGENLDFSVKKFNSFIDKNLLYPIFVEQGGVELNKFDWANEIDTARIGWTTPTIVMGNETNGIPDEILYDRAFPIVSIPQRGVIRSFNVAVTHGIVTWDMRSKMMGWI